MALRFSFLFVSATPPPNHLPEKQTKEKLSLCLYPPQEKVNML